MTVRVLCDQCGDDAEVGRIHLDLMAAEYDFCSMACAAKWTAEQAKREPAR